MHRYSGVSLPRAVVSVTLNGAGRRPVRHATTGALLITHWGLSGPAVLWCSAIAARDLAAVDYQANVTVQWDASTDTSALQGWMQQRRQQHGRKQVANDVPEHLPKRLWEWAVKRAQIPPDTTWAALRKEASAMLLEAAVMPTLPMNGRAVNKEEFVTAGGIERSAIDFRRMAVKNIPGCTPWVRLLMSTR